MEFQVYAGTMFVGRLHVRAQRGDVRALHFFTNTGGEIFVQKKCHDKLTGYKQLNFKRLASNKQWTACNVSC